LGISRLGAASYKLQAASEPPHELFIAAAFFIGEKEESMRYSSITFYKTITLLFE